MDLPLDWCNAFSSDERAAGVFADSPADGLILSLNNLGRVDIEYISQITGSDYKTVILSLKGAIYQNPDSWNECFYMGWETADEYLSGRIADKLKKAKRANEIYKGYFSGNVEALEKIIPKAAATEDIYITLGSPWVPTDVIDNFISYIFHDSSFFNFKEYNTKHDERTGTWKIPQKNRFSGRIIAEETYGTKKINALHIPIETKINNVLGISASGSSKCRDMMDKVRIVQKMNNGRGIVFATGTPISNSLTDAFVMQKYLQSGELALLGLQSFDSWVGMFAERDSEFEIDVDATNFRMATRFTSFHNIPELSTLQAQ